MLSTLKDQTTLEKLSILGQESIFIGSDITSTIAKDIISTCPSTHYVILSDHNVATFHLKILESELHQAIQNASLNEPVQVLSYLLVPGEQSKTREMKATVEDWLLSHKCTRDTCIIALGGGVVGDMAGNKIYFSFVFSFSQEKKKLDVNLMGNRIHRCYIHERCGFHTNSHNVISHG
jgi:pentafunctional AROM polypeptide